MTLDDYYRNLRGVNDGKDFDKDYLVSIYQVYLAAIVTHATYRNPSMKRSDTMKLLCQKNTRDALDSITDGNSCCNAPELLVHLLCAIPLHTTRISST